MRPHRSSPSQGKRAKLLQVETLYEQWRVAEVALAQCEASLWGEALRKRDTEVFRDLGAQVQRLRESARAARGRLLELLRHLSG